MSQQKFTDADFANDPFYSGDRVRPLMGIRSREKLYRSANDCGKPAIKRNPKVLKNLNGKGPHGNGKTAEASS
jgi:hypothetical protein